MKYNLQRIVAHYSDEGMCSGKGGINTNGQNRIVFTIIDFLLRLKFNRLKSKLETDLKIEK